MSNLLNLDLLVSTYCLLERNNINSIELLTTMSDYDIRNLRNMTPKAYSDIKHRLEANNIRLKEDLHNELG